MKKTKKGILCAVLCMAMILGTSLTSIDKKSVCEVYNQKPPTGYTFTNVLPNNNVMHFYRSTNPVKNFKLLYTFKYKI